LINMVGQKNTRKKEENTNDLNKAESQSKDQGRSKKKKKMYF